jgi:hypothetical protein
MSLPEEHESAEIARLACPGCGEEVDFAVEAIGKLVRCPYCNTDFFASVEQANQAVVDDTTDHLTALDREFALDNFRIRNHTLLRMSAIRARSWWIIGLLSAILFILEMVLTSVEYVIARHRWGIDPSLRVVAMLFAARFAIHCSRRAAEFKREIEKSAIPEPTTPPDFSTLSDGSERWKELENVR